MTIILVSSSRGRTFRELQDEVLAHGFSAVRYRERVKSWLNEAYGRVARHVNLSEIEQETAIGLEAGVSSYQLPSDSIRVVGVRVGHGALVGVSSGEFDALDDATGAPDVYSLFGSELRVSPAPREGDELRIRYRARPGRMVNDSDVPPMPDDYRDVLITYALSRAFRAEDDAELSQFYYGEFERDLGQLRTDVQERDESDRRQVPGMMGGGGAPRFTIPRAT